MMEGTEEEASAAPGGRARTAILFLGNVGTGKTTTARGLYGYLESQGLKVSYHNQDATGGNKKPFLS